MNNAAADPLAVMLEARSVALVGASHNTKTSDKTAQINKYYSIQQVFH